MLEFVGIFAQRYEKDDAIWQPAWNSLRRHGRDRVLRDNAIFHPAGGGLFRMEAAPFRVSLKMIVRGLYWHHTGRCLGLDTRMSANLWKPDAVLPLLSLFATKQIADGQFVYAYAIADDEPTNTMWYLQFHRTVLAGVSTGPDVNDLEDE